MAGVQKNTEKVTRNKSAVLLRLRTLQSFFKIVDFVYTIGRCNLKPYYSQRCSSMSQMQRGGVSVVSLRAISG